jgi:dihydropteroate synthase
MGILNLTPDSFSDGGLWYDPGDRNGSVERAVAHGLAMLDQGAVILDLGAESTRPGGGVYGDGAAEVPADEELARLLPVLVSLREATDAVLSVDTRKPAVAERALAAGADLVNDVGTLTDPEMVRVVAEAGCPVIAMHSRGDLATMQRDIAFDDVVTEVASELEEAARRAENAGLPPGRVIVDPGLGFGKTAAQNFELLARLPELVAHGRPVLVGASRKSFLGTVATGGRAPSERMAGSLAAAGRAAAGGAAILRVHDVTETVDFLATLRAFDDAEGTER